MSKTASTDVLAELHNLTALHMLKRLKDEPETLSAADLNAITKYLKDNNITAV